ncbi:MAG: hypothetical protein M1837_001382 [Sclerophora amabilis]|nr:MAG: hypothetical protein M1837_001382 [Sclerophora amabilis]
MTALDLSLRTFGHQSSVDARTSLFDGLDLAIPTIDAHSFGLDAPSLHGSSITHHSYSDVAAIAPVEEDSLSDDDELLYADFDPSQVQFPDDVPQDAEDSALSSLRSKKRKRSNGMSSQKKREKRHRRHKRTARTDEPLPNLSDVLNISAFNIESVPTYGSSVTSCAIPEDSQPRLSLLKLPPEMRNNIYEAWLDSITTPVDESHGEFTIPPIHPPDPGSLLLSHRQVYDEAFPLYAQLLSSHAILFSSPSELHHWLHLPPLHKCSALVRVHVIYQGACQDPQDLHAHEQGLPLAFDAFTILARACSGLQHLVIQRDSQFCLSLMNHHTRDSGTGAGPDPGPTASASAGLPLHEDFEGIWALRGVRGLKSLRFRGYKAVEPSLRAAMQREMKRKRPRGWAEEEEGNEQARALVARDSQAVRNALTARKRTRDRVARMV